MTRRNILVTGATGSLGRRTMARLALERIGAVGVGRDAPGWDLSDRNLTHDNVRGLEPDLIVHLAANIPRHGKASEEAVRENQAMVENLVACEPNAFVFVSTTKVYEGLSSGRPMAEDETAPRSAYAAGKLSSERLIQSCRGIRSTILRMPSLFGPPIWEGLLYNAAASLVRGVPLAPPANPSAWTAVHIDDAAAAVVAACRRTGPATVLNVGYPGPFSVRSGLTEIARRFGAPTPPCPDGPSMELDLSRMKAELGATPGTWPSRLDEFVSWVRAGAAGSDRGGDG